MIYMGEISRKEQDKLEYWIQRVQVDGKGLTKWEDDFIESLVVQWKEKRWMSEKQAEILERIYSEKTP